MTSCQCGRDPTGLLVDTFHDGGVYGITPMCDECAARSSYDDTHAGGRLSWFAPASQARIAGAMRVAGRGIPADGIRYLMRTSFAEPGGESRRTTSTQHPASREAGGSGKGRYDGIFRTS